MNLRFALRLTARLALPLLVFTIAPTSGAISQQSSFNAPPPGPHPITEGTIDPSAQSQTIDPEWWPAQTIGAVVERTMPAEIRKQFDFSGREDPGPLHLKAGDVVPSPGLDPRLIALKEQSSAQANDRESLYLLMQYNRRQPSAEQAGQLSEIGVQELEWVPENAVIARVPAGRLIELAELDFVHAMLPLQPEWKLDPGLAAQTAAFPEADHDVRVIAFEPLELPAGLTLLENTLIYQGRLTSDQIRHYLEHPLVQWIERSPQYQALLVTSARVLGVDNLWSHGWDGDGVRVGVIDTGIMRLHPHWDSHGGFIYATDWIDGGLPDDCGGHGTYVAGSISGSGTFNDQTFSGIALNSFVVVERIIDCDGHVPPGTPITIDQLYNDVANLGATVINGSWGNDSNGQYHSDSQAADTWARTHPNVTIVHANGNGCFPSVDCADDANAPALAKNVISVGATVDGSPGFPNGDPPTADSAPSVDLISAINNLNLPVDGRTKPDINAPGESITSSVITEDVYDTNGGSSIASPQVAGMIALKLQQVPGLRSDMIKAHLVNSAVPLETKPDQTGFTPGFGRASALDFMYQLPGEYIDSVVTGTASHGSFQCSGFSIPSGGGYLLRTTMTYMDQAGSLNASVARVNDLNLWTQYPSGSWGYALNNSVETVEKILIPNPDAGNWQVCVEGHSVSGLQDYALAVSVISQAPRLTVDAPGLIALSDMGSFELDIDLEAEDWFAYGAYATVELTDPFNPDLQLDPNSQSGRVFGDMYDETKTWSPRFNVSTCDDLPDAIRVTIGATNFTTWTRLVDVQVDCPAGDSYEPDGSWVTANWISNNSPQPHSIVPIGDSDWVKFTLPHRMGVILETDGPAGDTELWLYNDAVNEIDYDDDLGSGYFSLIDRDCASDPLEAGMYYAKVAEYNDDAQIQDYTLTASWTSCGDDYEPDDLSSQANWIYPDTPQTHNIVPVGDLDWVKFSLTETTGIVLETSGPIGDTELWLFDDQLSQIKYDDDAGNGTFSRIDIDCSSDPLSPGIYYALVGEYNDDHQIQTYDLTVTFAPCGGDADNFEPDDTPAQANWISSSVTQTHSIVPATDVDWLLFSLDGQADLLLETSGEAGDTYIELFDSQVHSIAVDDDSGENYFSRIARACMPPGTYYVKINEYNSDTEIAGYAIDMLVTAGDCNHIYLPMILK